MLVRCLSSPSSALDHRLKTGLNLWTLRHLDPETLEGGVMTIVSAARAPNPGDIVFYISELKGSAHGESC